MHTGSPKPGSLLAKNEEALRKLAMAYPETIEDHPWGHCAYKVRKKVFLFTACDEETLSVTVKLPESGFEALLLPFTEPTGYGMGKHGWVSARFGEKAKPPMALIACWIEESFRAIAPKKVVALLDGGGAAPVVKRSSTQAGKKKTAKQATKKKATKKRVAKRSPARKVTAKAAGKVAKEKTALKAAKKATAKTPRRRG